MNDIQVERLTRSFNSLCAAVLVGSITIVFIAVVWAIKREGK